MRQMNVESKIISSTARKKISKHASAECRELNAGSGKGSEIHNLQLRHDVSPRPGRRCVTYYILKMHCEPIAVRENKTILLLYYYYYARSRSNNV